MSMNAILNNIHQIRKNGGSIGLQNRNKIPIISPLSWSQGATTTSSCSYKSLSSTISDKFEGKENDLGQSNSKKRRSKSVNENTDLTSKIPISGPMQRRRSSSLSNAFCSTPLLSPKTSVYQVFPANLVPFKYSSIKKKNRRRSSISSENQITDDRNTADKRFQSNCFLKCKRFLVENKSKIKVSSSLLSNPSIGEVTSILQFLFSNFGFELGSNLESEVPKLLRDLGYPYIIRKSYLSSFNNSNSIGQLFGIFEWLIDSFLYVKGADPFKSQSSDKKDLIDVCLASDEIRLDLVQELVDKKYGTEEELHQIENQINEHEKRNEELNKEVEYINSLPDIIEEYKIKVGKIDEYLGKIQDYINKIKNNIIDYSVENDEKENSLKELKRKENELKSQLAKFNLDSTSVKLNEDRKHHLIGLIEKEQNETKKLKKEMQRLKSLEFDLFDKLKCMLDEVSYNVKAVKTLTNVPLFNDYIEEVQYTLQESVWDDTISSFTEHNMTTTMDFIKLKEDIQLFAHNTNRLKASLVHNLKHLEGTYTIVFKHKLQELSLLIEEKEERIKCKEAEIESLINELNLQREEIMHQINEIQKEIDENTKKLAKKFPASKKRRNRKK